MSPNSSKTRTEQVSSMPGINEATKVESKNVVKDAVPIKSEVETNGTSIVREKQDPSYVGWKQVGGWEEKDELTSEDLLVDVTRTLFWGTFYQINSMVIGIMKSLFSSSLVYVPLCWAILNPLSRPSLS